jgi:hypothetical protein
MIVPRRLHVLDAELSRRDDRDVEAQVMVQH